MSGQPSRLKKNKKGSAPVEPETLPEYTAEQARAILFGAGDHDLLASKIDYYANAWPSNFAGLVDFQRTAKAISALGLQNPLRQQWDRRVFEPILFSVLRTWVCGDSVSDVSMLSRVSDPQWVFLFKGKHEAATRVKLAIHICKVWKITIPPPWLRDLKFFVDYLSITDEEYDRGGAIGSLFDAIKSRLHELARMRFKADFETSSTLPTEDAVAKILAVSPDTIKKHRKAAEIALRSYFQSSITGEHIDFTPLDFIVFQVESEKFGSPR